jgi:hypothetical protein
MKKNSIAVVLLFMVIGVCFVTAVLHIRKESHKWETGVLETMIRGFDQPPESAKDNDARIAAIHAERDRWWRLAIVLGAAEILCAGVLIASLRSAAKKRAGAKPSSGC